MLRVSQIENDGCDVYSEETDEIIFTVWRADNESDSNLQVRTGNIASCINEEIRRARNSAKKKRTELII
jgi:hypothetical protein